MLFRSTAFGHDNGGTVSNFDFIFTPTGGTMISYFSGQVVGAYLISESSNFAGSFTIPFSGFTKGVVGAAPAPCTGTIGDFVWNDANQNGIQNSGEVGINGVQLSLMNGSTVVQTTTTGVGPANQLGYYQFTGVCAGTYTVQVTGGVPANFTPTLTGQGTPSTDSNPQPATVILATNSSSDQTIDFGYYSTCSGSIGDFVWSDLNHNGIQDAGELGIAWVPVTLYDALGITQLATTTTGSLGNYSFGGLCAGTYTVVVAPPAGMSPAPSQQGTNPAVDSNGSPALVTLPANNSTDNTIDFGFISPWTGAIGDYVWYDANQNGIQDANEVGIDGVSVTLKDSSGNLLATSVTTVGPGGNHGYYQFTGLGAATYSVQVVASTVPLHYTAATISNAAGSTTANDSNTQPATVTLGTNSSVDETIDFGYIATCSGSIGDFVWNDTANANGLQDAGELGIDFVTLNLRNLSNTILATTATANGGAYSFGGLCPGTYQVEVVTPNGFVPTATCAATGGVCAPGNTVPNDSNPNFWQVTLTEDNSSDSSVDFGFLQLPTLTVNKVIIPSPDTTPFNLNIDGVTKATGGDGTTTGPVVVSVGAHVVSETGGSLGSYNGVMGGDDCDVNGNVTVDRKSVV